MHDFAGATAPPLPQYLRPQNPHFTRSTSMSSYGALSHRWSQSQLKENVAFYEDVVDDIRPAFMPLDVVSARFREALTELARIHCEELMTGDWPGCSRFLASSSQGRESLKEEAAGRRSSYRTGVSSAATCRSSSPDSVIKGSRRGTKEGLSPSELLRPPVMPQAGAMKAMVKVSSQKLAPSPEELPMVRGTAPGPSDLNSFQKPPPPAMTVEPWSEKEQRVEMWSEAATSSADGAVSDVPVRKSSATSAVPTKGALRPSFGSSPCMDSWSRIVGALLYPEDVAIKSSSALSENSGTAAYMSAPDVEDEELELHPCWGRVHLRVPAGSMSSLARKERPSVETSMISLKNLPDDDVHRGTGLLQGWVAHPMSQRVAIVGAMAWVFFILDMVILPVQLIQDNGPIMRVYAPLSVVSTIFWCFDIGHSFFVGFEDQLCTEMRPRIVASHYMRRWFFMDLTVSTIDIANLVFRVGGVSEADARGERALKLLCLMHVLRLHHVVVATQMAFTRITAAHRRLFLKVSLIMLVIFLLAHQLACAWFALGERRQAEMTWLQMHMPEADSFGEKYLASLHWSLCQFTPSTNLIGPANTAERCFSVFVVALALVVSAGFISHLTSLFNQVRTLTMHQRLESAKLRQYLQERAISRKLTNRIHHYCWKAAHNQKDAGVRMEDVPLLADMPQRLKVMLHTELYSKHLQRIRPMRAFCKYGMSVVWELSVCACKERVIKPLEEVFDVGQLASDLYIVLDGVMRYHLSLQEEFKTEGGSAPHIQPDDYMLHPQLERWIGEPALALRWRHRGLFAGASRCRLISLNASSTLEYMCLHGNPVVLQLMRMHAIFLLEQLEAMLAEGVVLTDLEPSSEVSSRLIARTMRTLKLKTTAVSHAVTSVFQAQSTRTALQ